MMLRDRFDVPAPERHSGSWGFPAFVIPLAVCGLLLVAVWLVPWLLGTVLASGDGDAVGVAEVSGWLLGVSDVLIPCLVVGLVILCVCLAVLIRCYCWRPLGLLPSRSWLKSRTENVLVGSRVLPPNREFWGHPVWNFEYDRRRRFVEVRMVASFREQPFYAEGLEYALTAGLRATAVQLVPDGYLVYKAHYATPEQIEARAGGGLVG